MQATSNIRLQDIQQRLGRLESAVTSRVFPHSSETHDNLIAHLLPLSTIDSIKQLDTVLTNTDEAITQFVSVALVLINPIDTTVCT